MDSWLINANSCPSGYDRVSSNDCLKTAFGQSVPLQSITNLSTIAITGLASSKGDSIIATIGNTVYAKTYLLSDSLNYLSANWNDAEFNVMGSGNSSEAYFNNGASIALNVKADDGTILSPSCPGNSSFTGESNNLNYVTPPSPTILDAPSIALQESSNPVGGGGNLCSASGISQVAFEGTTTDLYTYAGAARLSDTGQRIKPATSPSITKLTTDGYTGGYEEAFQSTAGLLTLSGDAGSVSTTNAVMPGTNPSIATSPNFGPYEVAYQDIKGNLDLYSSLGNLPTKDAMKAGTSPSIAATPLGGGREVALQSSAGVLVLYGSTSLTTTLPMMANSSPSIAVAVDSGDFLVAYDGADGNLHTYSPSRGDSNTGNAIMLGTSPSVAALTNGGGFEEAFQNTSGTLSLVGTAGTYNSTNSMMKGSSPSIAAEAAGGFVEAIQTSSGSLMILNGNTYTAGGNLNTGEMLAYATSPSVAP